MPREKIKIKSKTLLTFSQIYVIMTESTTKNKTKAKGNQKMFRKGDRVTIKSLKHTKDRFGLVEEMSKILTGTVVINEGKAHSVAVKLDGSNNQWCYDTRDLTLNPNNASIVPISAKTSDTKTTVTFSDGSTTSVKKSAGDPYDLETAIAYCISKKLTTNSHIKHLAENAEEVLDKVNVEFYNKFLKPYGFLNENAYTDVEIETLKNYLKTLNDVRSEMALIAIENNLTKDELFNKLRG